MSKVFKRKQFSDYLGENRAILDIVDGYFSTPSPSPSSSPTPTPTTTATPTPTPTTTVTPTPTPTITSTSTPTPTPSNYHYICETQYNVSASGTIANATGSYTRTLNYSGGAFTGGYIDIDAGYTFVPGPAPDGRTYAIYNFFSGTRYYNVVMYWSAVGGSTTWKYRIASKTSNYPIELPGLTGSQLYILEVFYTALPIYNSVVYPPQVVQSIATTTYPSVCPSPTPTPTSTGTPTPTPTPSSTPPSYDPDAQAFFNAITTAGGSLTDGEKTATNQLVLDLKSYGLWTKMIGLYPVVGTSSISQSFNLADPTQYNLTFNGSWTHTSDGADPGGIGYAQTGIIPSVIDFQSLGSIHYAMYIQDNTFGGYDIGAFNSSQDWAAIANFNGNSTAYIGAGGGFFTANNGGSAEHNWLWTNDGTTSEIYRDGVSIGSGSSSINTGCTVELYLSANNNNGTDVDHAQRQWALASIGTGMDSTEASNYNTAVVAFQTSLSRQN